MRVQTTPVPVADYELPNKSVAVRRKKKTQVTWKDHIFPALRMMRGMSNKEAAELCDLCPSTIRRMRNDLTTVPRFETIAKIINAFGGVIVIRYKDDEDTKIANGIKRLTKKQRDLIN